MSFILNPHRFGAAADPGLTLLQSATLWLDASDDIANAQWKRNKGTGGRSLDARQGSVGSAQIVKGALKLPGLAANNASTPDSAALDITGNIEIVARIALVDWTPAAINTIVGKRATTANSFAYQFRVSTAGRLEMIYGDSPTTVVTATSTVSPTVSDGASLWVKVTRNSTTGTVQFFTAADQSAEPSSWTQLGTDVATASGSMQVNANVLVLGDHQTAGAYEPVNGSLFRVIIRNAIGSGVVFDADFTAVADLATSFTESSSNAATVTINSTTGVDTNDPLLLTHTGTNYLYLPGSASDYASAPDSAAISPSTEIELLIRVKFASYTANQVLILKTTGTSDFQWDINGGLMRFVWWNTGGTLSAPSVSSGSLVAGTDYWLRVTANSVGTSFWYAAGSASIPGSWTQLGTTQAGITTIRNASTDIRVGPTAAGDVYRAILRTTIGGTDQFDANFTANTNQSSFTESSSNAATVTINRATSGRKAVMVTRPVWLFGTDDYMEIADNALLNFNNESLTAVIVHRGFGTPGGAYYHILAKEGGTVYEGWSIINEATARAPRFHVGDGTNNATNNTAIPTLTAGQLTLSGGVWNESDGTAKTYNGSTLIDSDTSTPGAMGNISSTLPLRIGRPAYTSPAAYVDIEVVAVVVFRSALTSTQLGQIATYYGV